uniref:DUF632 domain-containing protein n=1 Tax=Setaria digitata TaxID=48799 RepID=A0A915PHL7_9BILA
MQDPKLHGTSLPLVVKEVTDIPHGAKGGDGAAGKDQVYKGSVEDSLASDLMMPLDQDKQVLLKLLMSLDLEFDGSSSPFDLEGMVDFSRRVEGRDEAEKEEIGREGGEAAADEGGHGDLAVSNVDSLDQTKQIVPSEFGPSSSSKSDEPMRLSEDERIVSASEIVPKTMKFEGKLFDVANKTDSNDIYINNDLQTSVSKSEKVPLQRSKLHTPGLSNMASDKSISLVEKETFETSENAFKSNAGKDSGMDELAYSSSDFTETINSWSEGTKFKAVRDKTMADGRIDGHMKLTELLKSGIITTDRMPPESVASIESNIRSLSQGIAGTAPITGSSTVRISAPTLKLEVNEGGSSKTKETNSGGFIKQIRQEWREDLEKLRQEIRGFGNNVKLMGNHDAMENYGTAAADTINLGQENRKVYFYCCSHSVIFKFPKSN